MKPYRYIITLCNNVSVCVARTKSDILYYTQDLDIHIPYSVILGDIKANAIGGEI